MSIFTEKGRWSEQGSHKVSIYIPVKTFFAQGDWVLQEYDVYTMSQMVLIKL